MTTETKPMTIRLSLTAKDGQTNSVTILVHGDSEDDFDNVVNAALIKMLRNTWYLAPGDVIRINQV